MVICGGYNSAVFDPDRSDNSCERFLIFYAIRLGTTLINTNLTVERLSSSKASIIVSIFQEIKYPGINTPSGRCTALISIMSTFLRRVLDP